LTKSLLNKKVFHVKSLPKEGRLFVDFIRIEAVKRRSLQVQRYKAANFRLPLFCKYYILRQRFYHQPLPYLGSSL